MDWRGYKAPSGCEVKQATRNIITQCSTIKQIHSRQPELALKSLVIYSDQPDSALKYTMVRLVIRNGQTLKIKPLFFLSWKKQNYSKNLTQWVRYKVRKISNFGAQVKDANNQVLTPGKCHSHVLCTLHISHPTSCHLLLQVPSCATQERKPGLGEGWEVR